MGRIKTRQIKRVTAEFFDKHQTELTDDFSRNKEVVDKRLDIPSKKLRNVVAGYLTRMFKKSQ